MTIEEIEARWKAATPGPWRNGMGNHPPRRVVFGPRQGTVVADFVNHNDLDAVAAAPTDIAYLLDRVREQDAAMVEWMDKCDAISRELSKYKRAHAWFVANTGKHHVYDLCEHRAGNHSEDCEWVKARDLTL